MATSFLGSVVPVRTAEGPPSSLSQQHSSHGVVSDSEHINLSSRVHRLASAVTITVKSFGNLRPKDLMNTMGL